MSQWVRGAGKIGGTLGPMWVVSFPLQAGAINICKAYANHPEERHNIAGMSEETLEIIQPRPLISGEKGDQGRDLLKVTQTS